MSQPRDCGACNACKERVCMWRTGSFEENHRPDVLGVIFLKKYDRNVEVKILLPTGKVPEEATPCIDQLATTMLVIIPEEERLIGPIHLVLEYAAKYRGYTGGRLNT